MASLFLQFLAPLPFPTHHLQSQARRLFLSKVYQSSPSLLSQCPSPYITIPSRVEMILKKKKKKHGCNQMYWKQKEPLALYFSIIQCLHNESTMRVSFPRQSRIARVLLRTFKWNYKFIRKYRELLQYPFHYGWNWKKKKNICPLGLNQWQMRLSKIV